MSRVFPGANELRNQLAQVETVEAGCQLLDEAMTQIVESREMGRTANGQKSTLDV
jgi:hypothetical protein